MDLRKKSSYKVGFAKKIVLLDKAICFCFKNTFIVLLLDKQIVELVLFDILKDLKPYLLFRKYH